MTFEDAITILQGGAKLARANWGYPKDAYIKLEQAPGGYDSLYMYNEYAEVKDPIGYGLTYQDVSSTDWIAVL